jgi:hypothetical protein
MGVDDLDRAPVLGVDEQVPPSVEGEALPFSGDRDRCGDLALCGIDDGDPAGGPVGDIDPLGLRVVLDPVGLYPEPVEDLEDLQGIEIEHDDGPVRACRDEAAPEQGDDGDPVDAVHMQILVINGL